MDIDSINAGTVDSKSWLNPTVGTLRAKKIICDDIEGGGGGGGGGGALALNSAANPGTYTDTLYGGTSPIIGGPNGYFPVDRLIPTSDLFASNSSFEFECSGMLSSLVAGNDNASVAVFGILVGNNDTYLNWASEVIGYTTVPLDGVLYGLDLVWIYKLVATTVASATQGGLAFTWTSEVSVSKNNATIGGFTNGAISRIARGKTDLGLEPTVNGGIRFSMIISNTAYGGLGDEMTVVKYNHTFRRIA